MLKRSCLPTITRIAWGVREWAEARRPRRWDPNLGGMCAISSRELVRRLRAAGFKPVLMYTEAHAFVTVRGHVVDVTATQFNTHMYLNQRDGKKYRPVEVVPLRLVKRDPVWGAPVDHSTSDLNKGAAYEKKNRWTRAPHQKLRKEYTLALTI